MSTPLVFCWSCLDWDKDLVLLHQEAVVAHEAGGGGGLLVLAAGTVAVGQVGVAVAHLTTILVFPLLHPSKGPILYLVAIVRDEEICPGPEYWSAAGVVRHGEQLLLDVKLAHVGT